MNLSINRYFKHKFFANNIIKTVMEKDESTNHYNLYFVLVEGDHIKGMANCTRFMIGTTFKQDSWKELIEEYAKNNQYVDFNPFLQSQEEATSFIQDCYISIRECPTLRLGQVIINHLNNKTPTPNIEIFNSTDNSDVLNWFHSNYLE
jgi:hypothetical protein